MAPSVIDHLLAFARPSLVLDSRATEVVEKLCEVVQQWLKDRTTRFLQSRLGEPLLSWYGSDCTPLSTRTIHRLELGDLRVRRNGRDTHDYLIERLFVLDRRGEVCVFFREPTRLQDKTAATHMQACLSLFPTPRKSGHEGIFIGFYAWDRALQKPLERLTRQYFAGLAEHERSKFSAGKAHMLAMTSWLCFVGCINHDIHNSLKWGALPFLMHKDSLKKAFVVLESLRNGFGELVRHLPSWLAARISHEGCADTNGLRELWHCVGVADEWIDRLVHLQLRFEDGRLKVGLEWEGNPELLDQISLCLLHLWKFKKFSDSRWMSIGFSCKGLVAAMLLGLRDLVAFALASPFGSDWFLRGFKHLEEDVLQLIGVIGMSSDLSDSLLQMLLRDDRVPRMLPALDQEIARHLAKVAAISHIVWAMVARAIDVSAVFLRDACVASTYTQAGFAQHRLRRAREPPFNLLQGDVGANLDALKDSAKPSEEVSSRIWELLRLGFNRKSIEDALGLLSQASWSSTPVEQGHVQASMMMRYHKQFTESTMRARAVVASFLPMVSESIAERKLQRLEHRLNALARKAPRRFTGRQMYMKMLVEQAKEQAWDSRRVDSNFTKKVMKHHGKLWRGVSLKRKLGFEQAADSARQQRLANLQARRRKLVEDLHQQQQRLLAEEVSEDRPRLRLTACKLSEAERLDLDNLFHDGGWARPRVAELRQRALVPTQPLAAPLVQALGALDIQRPPAPPPRPSWAPTLAFHREYFLKSVLRMEAPSGESQHFAFCFALQNPVLVCLCKVEIAEVVRPLRSVSEYMSDPWQCWDHRFALTSEFVYTDRDEFVGDSQVFVLAPAHRVEGGFVVSDGSWETLAVVQATLPSRGAVGAPSAAEEVVAEPSAGEERREPWLDHPWLLDFWASKDLESKGLKSSSSLQGPPEEHDGSSSDEFSEYDDSDLDALLAKRYELAARCGHTATDFDWELRGGRWTKARKGICYDCVAVGARGPYAQHWCQQMGLPREASFSVNLYGEDMSCKLAVWWAAKMQFLFDLAHGGSSSETAGLTRQQAASWTEPPEMATAFAEGSPPMRKRIAQLRSILPKRFVG